MTQITDAAEHIVKRSLNMFPILRDLERHLLAEQADAIAGPAESASAPRTVRPQSDENGPGDAESAAVVHLGHSDPVPSQAARLGYYTRKKHDLLGALDGINKALDHAERVAASAISQKPDPTLFDEPKCPGWTPELVARLGGCGAVTESYVRSDGTSGLRDLCARCRKAKQRAKRDDEREAA